jgi:hypothetical protein
MKILYGRYIVKRARTIKKLLLKAKYKDNITFNRMLQIYNCRIFGICFYRGEGLFRRDKRIIEELANKQQTEGDL